MKKNRKDTLAEIRKEAIARITNLLKKAGLTRLYISDYSDDSPIVHEHPYDDNLTYTLDEVALEEGNKLTFYSSSSWENTSDTADQLDTDTLVSIADWMEDDEEEIMELAKEEEEE